MTTYPNASFPLLENAVAIDLVRAAVERRQPFSLVRIGDGEGVAMSIGESSWLPDLRYLQSHWGGDRVTLGAVNRVRDDLRHALRGADVVGVRPDLVGVAAPDDVLDRSPGEITDFVRAEFALRAEERENLSAAGARRLALLHDESVKFEWDPQQQFCSQWIHWELLASGALVEILAGLDEVGIVTGKADLPTLLADRFDCRVRSVLVPDKFVDTRQAGAHVPDRYDEIRPELDVPAGTLVLVGAGIPGKAYCQWIKEAGGVAVDVGSVMDAWVGAASRPRVLASRFGVPGGRQVPAELQMRGPRATHSRGLTPRWKPDKTVSEKP